MKIKLFFKQLFVTILAWLNVVTITPCHLSYGLAEVVAYRGRFRHREIGYLSAIVSDNYVRIDHFRVRKRERKSGIGRSMMEELVKTLKEKGYREILAYPNSEAYENEPRIRPCTLYGIYNKYGFILRDIKADMVRANNEMFLNLQNEEQRLLPTLYEQNHLSDAVEKVEWILDIKCPPIAITANELFSFYDATEDLIVLVRRNDVGEMVGDVIHELRHVWQHKAEGSKYFNNYREAYEFDNVEDYLLQNEETDAIAFTLLVLEALNGYQDCLDDISPRVKKAIDDRKNVLLEEKECKGGLIQHNKLLKFYASFCAENINCILRKKRAFEMLQ